MQTFNAVKLAQYLLLPKVNEAQCMIDATAGTGRDTLFLAENSPNDSIVWAFDIQELAILKTQDLLNHHKVAPDKVKLVTDSHVSVASYVNNSPIDVAMFNLGYLPNAEHIITTHYQSTIEALQQILALLCTGGLISVVTYPGHQEGYLEQQAVHELFKSLPSKLFTVGSWSMLNHSNQPPILYVVEKTRSEASESFASRQNKSNN